VFRRDPEVWGRSVPVTSLTTLNIVCAQLAFGGVSPQKFAEKWAWRPLTASAADRIRRLTDFTSATGTLIHAGTAYADTTATGEVVFICEIEPYLIANAIDQAIRNTRRFDVTGIPSRQGQTDYWLTSSHPWIQEPNDILGIVESDRTELGINRHFDSWNTIGTDGVIQPDGWTIAGASATMARSTTGARRSPYTLAITRSGTDCTVLQTAPLLDSGGVTNTDLRGRTLSVVVRVRSTTGAATQIRGTVLDGTQTLYTSYHTATSGSVEELTTPIVVATAATTLQYGVSVEASNTECQLIEAYLVETLSNSVRTDAYWELKLQPDEWRFAQNGALKTRLPSTGIGRRWEIKSQRPYPGFDATRLAAGTADQDSQDAPLETVAVGAIYYLYLAKLGKNSETTKTWKSDWDTLRAKHMYIEDGNAGIQVNRRQLAPAARRMG
jgi:hypothetical protein